MTTMEIMQRNRQVEFAHSKEFWMHFHLRLHDYMDYLTGFNIVKFDKDIRTPDGISARDHIENQYGMGAVGLIKVLIGMPKRIITR